MSGVSQSVHGQWSGHFAFVLAATGAAVGLGNIWKFPYIMGENGGGAFMLLYLLFIFVIGLPIMMAEVMIGRRGRQSPGYSVKAVAIEAKASTKWQIAGWSGLVASYLILSFYAVIAGWALSYIFKAASGSFENASAETVSRIFSDFSGDAVSMMFWTAVIVIMTCVVVGKGVKQGLEKASVYMMPLLLVLLIFMAIYASVTGAFMEAVNFMFTPDFSKITVNGVLTALGHAFFSLSLASGVMIIYGAYLPRNVSITGAAIIIAVADTCVSLISSLVIYPIVFSHGLEASTGPGLIFVTLPIAFGSMPGGILIGTLFFIMIVFAAFTSTIAMIESTVAWLVESKGMTRWQASAASGCVLWLISLLSVYSFSGAEWAQHQINFLGKNVNNFFEMLDHLTADIMLPLGGLVVALFAGWVMTSDAARDELNTRPWIFKTWYFTIRWVTPVAIIVVFLNLIGLF